MLSMIAVAAALSGATLLACSRWFTRRRQEEFPCYQVACAPPGTDHCTRATITLRASSRRFRLARITFDHDRGGRPPVHRPDGFELERDRRIQRGVVSWIPTSRILFEPGRPVQLEFTFAADLNRPIDLCLWTVPASGRTGAMVPFTLRVGPRHAAGVDAANLRSRLFVESVERGTAVQNHPERPLLDRLEAAAEAAATTIPAAPPHPPITTAAGA